MKKRILEYRMRIDNILNNSQSTESDESEIAINWNKVKEEHLVQISFFQHERLVHLIVTALVALLFIICFGIAMISEIFQMFVPAIILFILFIPYIAHYYLLENEVQKMYNQYDEILKKIM